MPAKFYSAGGSASFGLDDESGFGFLADSFSYDVTSDKAEIYDTNGDLVQTHRYNKKASISMSGYGTSPLAVGDVAPALANAAGGQLSGTILVDSVTTTLSSSDFERIDLSLTQYEVALT